MREIHKKTWPEDFDAVARGEKKYELRLADFACEPGDTLVLREWDPAKQAYTGREARKRVTSVSMTKDQRWYPPEDVEKYGWQILSLE